MFSGKREHTIQEQSGVVWSSEQAHVADAMAAGGDEGRTNLRKAQMSR